MPDRSGRAAGPSRQSVQPGHSPQMPMLCARCPGSGPPRRCWPRPSLIRLSTERREYPARGRSTEAGPGFRGLPADRDAEGGGALTWRACMGRSRRQPTSSAAGALSCMGCPDAPLRCRLILHTGQSAFRTCVVVGCQFSADGPIGALLGRWALNRAWNQTSCKLRLQGVFRTVQRCAERQRVRAAIAPAAVLCDQLCLAAGQCMRMCSSR